MNSDHIEVSTSQVADVRDGSLTSVTTLSSPPLPHSSTDPSSTVTTGPAPPPTPECELRSRSLLLHTPSGPVRVDPVAPGDLVTETFPPPPPSDPVEVSLHTSLPYGRVFSAFAATAAVGEGVEVVAKIAHASPAVREEVAWEAWLYVQRLIIPVVPHFHGLFAGGGHLVALLEPVGHEVVVGALSVSEQQAIIAAYAALHAAGVVHRTSKPKHWMTSSTGLRLIDFGDSAVLEAPDVPDWAPRGRVLSQEFFKALADDEMVRVRHALGI